VHGALYESLYRAHRQRAVRVRGLPDESRMPQGRQRMGQLAGEGGGGGEGGGEGGRAAHVAVLTTA